MCHQRCRLFLARWRTQVAEGQTGTQRPNDRSLAKHLVADGETVLDVLAKLAPGFWLYSRGRGRKTDRDNAVSIRLAVGDGTGCSP